MRNRVVTRKFGLTLVALLLWGCTTVPLYKGVAQEDVAAFTLGMTVDAQQQVVEVVPASAAEEAGVAVGDQLISLTWVLSEAPENVGSSVEITTPLTTTITSTITPIRPAAGVEYKTVAFTEPEGIRTLTGYGVPLRLEIVRQGEAHVLTIIPEPREDGAVMPTAAPGHEVY